MPVGPPTPPNPADAPPLHLGNHDVTVLRSPADPRLATLEEGWDRLALSAPQRLPQLSPAWVKAYWATRVGASESMRVYVIATRGDVVAVLPLLRRGGGLRGPRLVVPHDDHTKSGDVLMRADAPATLKRLLTAVREDQGRWFSLGLSGVRDSSPTFHALGDLGAAVHRVADERGSTMPVTSMDEIRGRLGDNFRRNVKKAGNRLAKEAGVSFRFLSGSDATPEVLDRFLALESAGWKGRGGTAIAKDAGLVAFYRALVANFAARGRLEAHLLEIGGETAAMHLGVRFGRALVLMKIAYDEKFARLGPGNLLFDRLLERECEAKTVDEVNCLTDMPWHRNWAMPQSEYARVTLFPKRPWPLLAGCLPARLRERLKRVGWLRRMVAKRRRPTDAMPAGSPSGDAAARDGSNGSDSS